MAQGDIKFKSGDKFGLPAAQEYQVAAGAAGSILPGEPVVLNTGSRRYVLPAADGDGVIGTDEIVGIAENTSSDTVAADGSVRAHLPSPGTLYIAKAKSSAAVATQALYDALVGKRVVLDLTAGSYTIDTAAADNANNAILIRDLDIENYPGQVAFEIRLSGTILS